MTQTANSDVAALLREGWRRSDSTFAVAHRYLYEEAMDLYGLDAEMVLDKFGIRGLKRIYDLAIARAEGGTR